MILGMMFHIFNIKCVGGRRFGGAVILAIFLLSACAILPVDQMPIRSRQDFLQDIRALATSGALENVDYVSRVLRIDFRPHAEQPVYDDTGSVVRGYRVEVGRGALSKEYRSSDSFNYGIFIPNGRGFNRVRISMSINSDLICVTILDLFDVFGSSVGHPGSHGFGRGYEYAFEKNDVLVYFMFFGGECLSSIYFSKNRELR